MYIWKKNITDGMCFYVIQLCKLFLEKLNGASHSRIYMTIQVQTNLYENEKVSPIMYTLLFLPTMMNFTILITGCVTSSRLIYGDVIKETPYLFESSIHVSCEGNEIHDHEPPSHAHHSTFLLFSSCVGYTLHYPHMDFFE